MSAALAAGLPVVAVVVFYLGVLFERRQHADSVRVFGSVVHADAVARAIEERKRHKNWWTIDDCPSDERLLDEVRVWINRGRPAFVPKNNNDAEMYP